MPKPPPPRIPEIVPATIPPIPTPPDSGPDWTFVSLVSLMAPAMLAGAVAGLGGNSSGSGGTSTTPNP